MSQPLLRVENLRKKYGAVEVLRGIDFSVRKGEKVALIGPSGSGKSTCLRCVNMLEKPTGGAIYLDDARVGVRDPGTRRERLMSDAELAPQRRQMGMVFQLFYLWPHLTVLENVSIGLRRVQNLPAKAADEIAVEMLEKVSSALQSPERSRSGLRCFYLMSLPQRSIRNSSARCSTSSTNSLTRAALCCS